MKANELRLGNYIYRNGLMEVRVISKSGVKVYDHVNKMFHPTYFSLDENIQPIQLTEEWLRKFGFDDKEYKKGFIGIDVNHMNFVLTKPHGEYDYDCFAWEYKNDIWPKYNEFKYVHQLQNFYYDLTGKELTL